MREENEEQEKKPEPKPVNVKNNVQALVTALNTAKSSEKYKVMEKGYPSDLPFLPKEGKSINSPVLVNYISRAEMKFINNNVKEVINIAQSMIEKDLEEIKEMLG